MRDAGLHGPALVWAVRSVEVYIKEMILLPLFLETFEGDWYRARKEIRQLFASANWKRAMAVINETYGPLAPMRTDDEMDVWQVWSTRVAGRRGDIVHGGDEPTAEEAALVVKWAEMMMTQLSLRLIVAKKHPLHDLFGNAIKAAAVAVARTNEIPLEPFEK